MPAKFPVRKLMKGGSLRPQQRKDILTRKATPRKRKKLQLLLPDIPPDCNPELW